MSDTTVFHLYDYSKRRTYFCKHYYTIAPTVLYWKKILLKSHHIHKPLSFFISSHFYPKKEILVYILSSICEILKPSFLYVTPSCHDNIPSFNDLSEKYFSIWETLWCLYSMLVFFSSLYSSAQSSETTSWEFEYFNNPKTSHPQL